MATSRKPRTLRREAARRTAHDVRERTRLALLLPGGAPERPIDVVSASLVEPVARGLPCAVCGGSVRVGDHAAQTIDGAPLRLARVDCPSCGHERTLYFAIRPPLPN